MRTKKLLASIMTIAMLTTTIPLTALAAPGGRSGAAGQRPAAAGPRTTQALNLTISGPQGTVTTAADANITINVENCSPNEKIEVTLEKVDGITYGKAAASGPAFSQTKDDGKPDDSGKDEVKYSFTANEENVGKDKEAGTGTITIPLRAEAADEYKIKVSANDVSKEVTLNAKSMTLSVAGPKEALGLKQNGDIVVSAKNVLKDEEIVLVLPKVGKVSYGDAAIAGEAFKNGSIKPEDKEANPLKYTIKANANGEGTITIPVQATAAGKYNLSVNGMPVELSVTEPGLTVKGISGPVRPNADATITLEAVDCVKEDKLTVSITNTTKNMKDKKLVYGDARVDGAAFAGGGGDLKTDKKGATATYNLTASANGNGTISIPVKATAAGEYQLEVNGTKLTLSVKTVTLTSSIAPGQIKTGESATITIDVANCQAGEDVIVTLPVKDGLTYNQATAKGDAFGNDKADPITAGNDKTYTFTPSAAGSGSITIPAKGDKGGKYTIKAPGKDLSLTVQEPEVTVTPPAKTEVKPNEVVNIPVKVEDCKPSDKVTLEVTRNSNLEYKPAIVSGDAFTNGTVNPTATGDIVKYSLTAVNDGSGQVVIPVQPTKAGTYNLEVNGTPVKLQAEQPDDPTFTITDPAAAEINQSTTLKIDVDNLTKDDVVKVLVKASSNKVSFDKATAAGDAFSGNINADKNGTEASYSFKATAGGKTTLSIPVRASDDGNYDLTVSGTIGNTAIKGGKTVKLTVNDTPSTTPNNTVSPYGSVIAVDPNYETAQAGPVSKDSEGVEFDLVLVNLNQQNISGSVYAASSRGDTETFYYKNVKGEWIKAENGRINTKDVSNGGTSLSIRVKIVSNTSGPFRFAVGLDSVCVRPYVNQSRMPSGHDSTHIIQQTTFAGEFTPAPATDVHLTSDYDEDNNVKPANGIDTYTLRANVFTSGIPVGGQDVTFSITSGSGATLTKTRVTTTVAGRAETKIYASRDGSVIIQAKANNKTDTTTVVFGSTGVTNIKAESENNQKVARGEGYKEFKFSCYDARGNRVNYNSNIDLTKTVVTKPSGAALTEKNGFVVRADTDNTGYGVIEIDTNRLTKDGTYEVQIHLVNGTKVTYRFSAKEQGEVTGMRLKYGSNSYAAGTYVPVPEIAYTDREGYEVTRKVSDVSNEVKVSISDASFLKGSLTNGAFTLKEDKTGSVTMTAVDVSKSLVATQVLTINRAASYLKVEPSATGVVGGDVTFNIQLVDVDGNPVANGIRANASESSAIVINKPDGAVAYTAPIDVSKFDQGKASVKVSSNKEGKVSVQVIISEESANGSGGRVFTGLGVASFGTGSSSYKDVIFIVGSYTYVTGDKPMSSDSPAYIDAKTGRTFLSVRDAGTSIGATIWWDQYSQTATLVKDDITLKITVGKTYLTVTKNGVTSEYTFDAPSVNKNGRIYLPFRAVLEAFGYEVNFDSATQAIVCKMK
ncbi:MAG: stalk domain-containing protein [Clostridiales bacterium]